MFNCNNSWVNGDTYVHRQIDLSRISYGSGCPRVADVEVTSGSARNIGDDTSDQHIFKATNNCSRGVNQFSERANISHKWLKCVCCLSKHRHSFAAANKK